MLWNVSLLDACPEGVPEERPDNPALSNTHLAPSRGGLGIEAESEAWLLTLSLGKVRQ